MTENKSEEKKETSGSQVSRRSFLSKFGFSAVVIALLGETWVFLRSLFPNVLYEPDKRYKIGSPEDFPEGVTFLDKKRIYVIKESKTFHVISGICTHLGCSVKYVKLNQPKIIEKDNEEVTMEYEFHCPCHGSKFHGDGANYSGPAPKPLDWYGIELSVEDGQLEIDENNKGKNNLYLKT